MAVKPTQQISLIAKDAAVNKLPAKQLLLLYNEITANDKAAAEVDVDLKQLIIARAENVLDKDARISDNNDTDAVYANEFAYGLDDVKQHNATEYAKEVTYAKDLLSSLGNIAEDDITWLRDNYAEEKAKFNEAAETFAKETGTDIVSFEQAATLSEGNPEWVTNLRTTLQDKYGRVLNSGEAADVRTVEADTSKMSKTALDAYATMVAVTNELLLHANALVGDDTQVHTVGFNDLEQTLFRTGGTGGKADDREGIGEDKIGSGIGHGIAGKGDGSGYGNELGDGGDPLATAAKDAAKTAALSEQQQSVALSEKDLLQTTADTSISKYADAIAEEPRVNNIFKNAYYNTKPVPHWAFSVDFIPTEQAAIAEQNIYDISKLLTKSVITATVPARVVNSVVSHFKGMSIELAARAITSGELKLTFAENELFQISNALELLFKFARQETYYDLDNNSFMIYVTNAYKSYVTSLSEDATAMSLTDFIASFKTLQAFRKYLADNAHVFNIVVKLYKAVDTLAFNDVDTDAWPTMVYYYSGCDLQAIDKIDFDYTQDKPVDVSCTFVYQYFEELTYQEYMLRYGGANNPAAIKATDKEMIDFADAAANLAQLDQLDADLYEASDEEMINAADNAVDLAQLDQLELSLYAATDQEMIDAVDNASKPVHSANTQQETTQISSPKTAYDFINSSKLTGTARKQAALAAGISEVDYAAGQKMINTKYAKSNKQLAVAEQPAKIENKPAVNQLLQELKQTYNANSGNLEDKQQYLSVAKELAQTDLFTEQGADEWQQHRAELKAAQVLGTSVQNAKQIVAMAPGLFANTPTADLQIPGVTEYMNLKATSTADNGQ